MKDTPHTDSDKTNHTTPTTGPANYRISDEMFRALAPLAAQHGLDLGDYTQLVPKVWVNEPILRLSEQVGQLLSRQEFFRRGDQVVRVDERSREVRVMNPLRFCSEVERHIQFIKPYKREGEIETSIGKDKAAQVLESSAFLACLRPLEAVNRLRLPVRREDGRVELLPAGYDDAAAVYTFQELEYDLEMDPNDAAVWLCGTLLKDYPWAELGDGKREPRDIMNNRSASVLVAAMLGVYCRHLFPAGTARPMVLILGNQPGTGKTTLVQMALAPVHGMASYTDCPKNAGEMEKVLATEAQAFAPYVAFDDLGAGLYSNALNRFVTASRHSGRILGTASKFDVPSVSQVFATGNNVETAPDLMRRILAVELFLPGEVAGRKFDHTIDAEWLASAEVRAKTCAALWSMVKVWMECPAHEVPQPRPSFETWTRTIGHIMVSNAWANPLVDPDLPAGGDREEQEFRKLLVDLATGIEDDAMEDGPLIFTREELVVRARELEILEDLVGSRGEPELKPGDNRRLGRRLQKWRGRELVDRKGRRFEFGRRRSGGVSTYPVRFV